MLLLNHEDRLASLLATSSLSYDISFSRSTVKVKNVMEVRFFAPRFLVSAFAGVHHAPF